ncbi:MAG: glycoside hydrolase family 3 C-terminal domain-containing protein [Parasporobacterium sp.]|nr:glycoside hydrolase family 3 C-terminal domain-containing protein [Parasporobacterium sp.]
MRGFKLNSDTWLNRYDNIFHKAEDDFASEFRHAIFPPKIREITTLVMKGVELPPMAVSQTHIESSPADAAIYVMSRISSEGTDNSLEPGSFYPDPTESESIRRLAKAYKRFVLVINTGNIVDLGFTDDISGINAIIYMNNLGGLGGLALADVLRGNVNPSGKLVDTWPMKYEDIPGGKTFGNLDNNPRETVYTEDCFVGYRHFDAHGIKPRYSFGFGLSYTTFKTEYIAGAVDNNIVDISLRVTNTGHCTGKEVVQAYFSREQALNTGDYRDLVCFAKTKMLEPGESETINLKFSGKDAARFDQVDKMFCLAEGDYSLYIGNSLDNTPIKIQLHMMEERFLSRIGSPMTNRSKTFHSVERRVDETLERMDLPDKIRLTVGMGMSIMGKQPDYYTPGAVGHTAPLPDAGIDNMELADGPAGLRLAAKYGVYPDGRWKPVDPPFRALKYLPSICHGLLMADSKKTKVYSQHTTAYPAATALAQTWNEEMLTLIGQCVSEEMTEHNITFWLAPALNIHRNPLCGRNFEYFSEDPILSGKCAAAIVKGVQSVPGHVAVIKHFACNNQEDMREFSNSIVKETALRDIYLKGFEIAIREGRPGAVMTSYNLINGRYAASHPMLLTQVLRGEWNFDGVVMTDWTASKQSPAAEIIAAGGDMMMPGDKADVRSVTRAIESGALSEEQLEMACRRILRVYFEGRLNRQTEYSVGYTEADS